MATVTWYKRAYMGHAVPASQKAVATALMVAVPGRTAVQMARAPWGGGEGAGSGASRPSGATVAAVQRMVGSSSRRRTESPTRNDTVLPPSAAVTVTCTADPPAGRRVVGGVGCVGATVVGAVGGAGEADDVTGAVAAVEVVDAVDVVDVVAVVAPPQPAKRATAAAPRRRR
jgi:hypothetical protein